MCPGFRELAQNHNRVGRNSPRTKDKKMKPIQFSKLLVLSLILTVAATGCKKTPVKVTDMNGPRTGYNAASGENNAITNLPPTEPIKPGSEADATSRLKDGGIPSVGPDRFKNYLAHPEILKAYSVYFDFDSSVIKSGEKPKINSVAEYSERAPGPCGQNRRQLRRARHRGIQSRAGRAPRPGLARGVGRARH